MIKQYKDKISEKKINKITDYSKQLNLLKIEDEKRLRSKYSYELDCLIILLNIKITDEQNEKLYQPYREKIKEIIPQVYNVIQNPNKFDNLDFLNNIIDCPITDITNMTSYYYSKLLEYENNESMSNMLIEHLKKHILPFNENIRNISELFCLLKAFNYYNFMNKSGNAVL